MINLFKSVQKTKLLFFIGSGRTGSTILGQIINYHPQCLVSNEYRFLQKVIKENIPINKALKEMKKTALYQFKRGLENDSKYAKNLDRYQMKWIPFQGLSKDKDFKKKEILLLGDKKAGGNTEIYINHPEEVTKIIKSYYEAKLIQIVRNPVSASLSLMKSHNIQSFEEACEHIIYYNKKAYELGMSKLCPYYYLYYEELLKNPEAEIKKLIQWLGLEMNERWLKIISQKINQKQQIVNDSSLQKISWEIVKKHNAETLFSIFYPGQYDE